MEVLYERCCGLDVHQATVVGCVRRQGERRRRASEVRTFGTTTAELLDLADWLTAEGVTHVAMESTGVFWKPVFNILARGRVRGHLGERPAHQGGPRTEDRRARL
jgi:transposase